MLLGFSPDAVNGLKITINIREGLSTLCVSNAVLFVRGFFPKMGWAGGVLHVNEPKKMGALSARARSAAQNPLVYSYAGICSYERVLFPASWL